MLWTIMLVLLVLWALGFGFAGAAVGNLIHILLVLALVVLVVVAPSEVWVGTYRGGVPVRVGLGLAAVMVVVALGRRWRSWCGSTRCASTATP